MSDYEDWLDAQKGRLRRATNAAVNYAYALLEIAERKNLPIPACYLTTTQASSDVSIVFVCAKHDELEALMGQIEDLTPVLRRSGFVTSVGTYLTPLFGKPLWLRKSEGWRGPPVDFDPELVPLIVHVPRVYEHEGLDESRETGERRMIVLRWLGLDAVTVASASRPAPSRTP